MPAMDNDTRLAVLRAMRHPNRYLAAALGELPDKEVAHALMAHPARVYRLRLMEWPRAGQWETDVRQMAAAIGAQPDLLAALVRELDLPSKGRG